ncbi:divisome protein SepX/GlpR, partial [Nocardia cerradoensis]
MPNSILWIALVVLWVFVLFPMLADRHPRIRRTTDVALATRVLHRGGTRRRAKKGPATGHETDPDWVPAPRQKRLSHGDDAEDRMTTSADEPVIEDDRNAPERAESEVTRARRSAGDPPGRAVAGEEHARETPVDAADAEPDGDEPGDVDGTAEGESGGDLAGDARDGDPDDADDREEADDVPAPATEDRPQTSMARIPPAPGAAVPARRGGVDPDDDLDDDLDNSDDLDDRVGDEPGSAARDFVPSRRGRGGFDPEADAIARAARYRFRQRTALGLILSTL